MPSGFRTLEHTADIGLEAHADSATELFRQAALALIAIAFDQEAIHVHDEQLVDVTGDDLPTLLVGVLEEILYRFDSDRFATVDCEIVSLEPTRARLRLLGEPRVPAQHRWTLMIKAVTYHGLVVVERDGQWIARVFLDV